jgi:hypothetical protein
LTSSASPTTAATIDAGTGARTITLSASATLEGFTILAGGTQTDNGVITVNGNSARVLSNIVTSTGTNDAIHFVNSANSVIVNGNTVTCFRAEINAASGAICAHYGNNFYLITNNRVRITNPSSTSGQDYGILVSQGGSGTVTTNEVNGCQYGIGSNMWDATRVATIESNTIVNYTARGINLWTRDGGACTYIVRNNIVSNNPGGGAGATGTSGIFRQTGTVTSKYNNIYSNATNWNGTASGEGDISQTANFVSTVEADFRLAGNSPCINTGTPEGTDMGYYQYTAPTVSITAPNGGETWTGGSTQNITWSPSETGSGVDLYYSIDGGATYTSIATDQTDTGTYAWTVPNIPTTEAKVKVEDTINAAVATDESAAVFTITRATNYYVNASTGNNSNTGLSTDQAWKTLTYASTMAASGDLVNVAAGLYDIANNGETFPISVPAGVHFLAATTTATIERVDADPDGYVIQMGARSTLEGFTVSDGEYYDGTILIAADTVEVISNNITTTHQYTYGIVLSGTRDNIKITGNTISAGNYQGRGIYGSGATVTNLLISYNTIEALGACINDENGSWPNATITQNKLIGAAGTSGYGIIIRPGGSGSVTTVSSNEIRDIDSYAGLYNLSNGATTNAYNNTFVNCKRGIWGGGIINATNNIFCGAAVLGSHVSGLTGIEVSNATVNSTNNNFYDIDTAYSGDTITISNDTTYYPRFFAGSTNDYRLFSDSPCLTAGVGGTYQGRYGSAGSASSLANSSWVDAVNGNDTTGTGIEGNPWKSITKALQNTLQTINVVANGNHTSAIETFPLTLVGIHLRKSGTGIATIDASGVAANTLYTGANVTIEGFTIKGDDVNYYLLQIGSAGVQILNNTIEASTLSGGGSNLYLFSAADNCLINNNTITSSRLCAISSPQSQSYPDNLTITNNTITESYTSGNGFAIYFPPENYQSGSNFTCTGNTITTGGYGIYSSGYLNNVTISSNKIIGPGANGMMGIYTNASSGTNNITSNEVRGFQNATYGTAIYINAGTYTIDHNTLVNNRNGLYGNGGTLTIKNSIICGAPRLGSNLGLGETGIVQVSATITSRYNTLFNLVKYSGTVGDQTGDNTACPRFFAASANDYRLCSDSPCINTADDSSNRGAYGSVETSSGITTESWVDAVNGSNDYNGSFATPFKTIIYALATTEQTIHVKAGTYDVALGESFPISLSAGQYLQSVASPTTLATIDSTGQSAKTVQLAANNTIEGFTIKSDFGGATLYVFGLANVLTNTITNSASSAYGVNLTSAADGSQIIGNNIWVGNSSTYGIADAGYTDNLLLRSNTIESGTSGYGIYINYYSNNASIESNFITAKYRGIYLQYYGNNHVVSSNIIRSNGGTEGIYNYAVYTTTICSNEVVGFTTNGIYLYSATLSNVYNNTLVNNSGIGIYNVAGKTDLWNNIIACTAEAGTTGLSVAGGDVTYSYSDVNNYTTAISGGSDGGGNITSNPLFVDPGILNYHLSGGSPCISNGTPEGSYMGCYPATAGTITLRTPNGGETWNGMQNNDITWESTGDFAGINIYYSVDSGATYTQIATNESNDGSYTWFVPALSTDEARVKITGLPGESISSESAADFTITTPPAPTVDTINPAIGDNNATLNGVTISGLNFVSTPTVKLTRSGQADINATDVVRDTPQHLTFNLPLSGAATGAWNVVVTNPDTQSGTLGGGFTITYPAPTVTSISPTAGTVSGNTLVTIEGTGIRPPSYEREITINNSGAELTNFQVLVTVETDSLVSAGKMRSDCGDIRFYASDRSTLLSYWLESGANSAQTNLWVKVPTVTAAGNTTIYLNYGDPTATSASDGTSTFIFFDDFSATGIDASKWTLVDPSGYITTEGGTLVCSGGPNGWGNCGLYSISSLARPFVFELNHYQTSSQYMMHGLKNTSANINYTDLIYAGYPCYDGSNGLTVYEDGNWRGGNLKAISSNTWQYYKYVVLETGTNYYKGDSTTAYGDPYYSSVYSTSSPLKLGLTNYNQAFKIDNTRVRKYAAAEPTATVSDETSALLKAYFGTLEATSVTYLSSTKLNARTPAHSAGLVDVTVVNSDNRAGTLESGYTYNAVPTITEVSPSSGVYTGEVGVTITGTNFQTGGTTTVKLTKAAQSDINATGVVVVNSTQITCNLDINGAATGVWTLTVTEPDSQTASNSFTITYPPPTVTSVSPASGPIAGGTAVTIEGTGFRLAHYQREVTINNSGGALADFQVLVTMETASLVSAGKMKSSCGDVRFYKSDGTTATPYWIESGANSAETKFWVRATLEAGDNTFYLRYGDLTLADGSDGTATFLFFDDFSGASLDTNKWNPNVVNTITSSISGGHLRVTDASGSWIYASETGSQHQAKDFSAVDNVVIEWKSYAVASGDMGEVGVALVSDSNNVCAYLAHSDWNGGPSVPWRSWAWGGSYSSEDGSLPESCDFKIIRSDTTAKFYINNTIKTTQTMSGTPAKLAITIGKYSGYDFRISEIDDVRVRKYTATEPTFSLAAETAPMSILFGTLEATGTAYINSTTLTATTPAHSAGAVNVTVTNSDSQVGTLEGGFTYIGDTTISVTLETPNGGEEWIEGENYNITWESSGSPDSINLYYSVDNGATYTEIITNEADDGIYSWLVPNEPTSDAKVKIEAIKDTTIATDESDTVFTIEASVLSITLRTADDLADFTTWEVGAYKSLNTVYIMGTTECVLVKNNGNIAIDLGISGEATNWTLSPTAEVEQNICALMGIFNGPTIATAEAFVPDNDVITGSFVWATSNSGNGKYEGEESGANISNGTNRRLYLYLKTPTAITSGAQEQFTINIGCRRH